MSQFRIITQTLAANLNQPRRDVRYLTRKAELARHEDERAAALYVAEADCAKYQRELRGLLRSVGLLPLQ